MNVFDRLRQAVLRASSEAGLPDELAVRTLRIADHPQDYADRTEAVAELADQVDEYDTFAQTGYMGMGVDHVVLAASLDRLERG